jgi:integrase
MALERVKLSDAKEWAIRLKGNGVAYQTVSNYKRSLKAAFFTAIQDDYVRKNPFDFQLADVIENDTKKKVPLTPEQQTGLLEFLKEDSVFNKYYDEVVILMGTGLRISELCGLTVKDLNFTDRTIRVDHQLLHRGKEDFYIQTPKTDSGTRQIPMTPEVYEAFKRVKARPRPKTQRMVDGHSNFLFLTQEGNLTYNTYYSGVCRRILKKYNKTHEDQIQMLTPHTFRHTFCTNFANAGMNPKALQYLMGHANITMTLNYYAHATFESAKAEMERLVA